MNRLIDFLPLAVVAWGVLAFGSVYPWAYRPLLCAALFSGLVELWRGRSMLRHRPIPGLAVALLLLGLASAAQLVPLPRRLLSTLSPATDTLLRQYAVGYSSAVAAEAGHALSIAPMATATGLAFVLVFGVFLLGLIVRVARRGAMDLVGTVTVLGLVVAITAIVQRATGTQKVYGVWEPYERTTPFGPFVNRNHFAGWILMALPLVLGAAWARGRRHQIRAGWRNRMTWLGSVDANQLVLMATIALVMALALVLSLSRSGIAALLVTLGVLFGAAWTSARAMTRRWLAAYAVLFVAVAFGWGGTASLNARLLEAKADIVHRSDAWRDAARVARAFPLAGSGLNTYGTAMLFYQQVDPHEHYAQAHNDYLQLAAEGGWLLCVPALFFFAVLGYETWGSTRRFEVDGIRAGAIVGLLAILVQEAGDFSLQMPGNAVLFCVLCAVAVHHRVRRTPVASEQP